MTPVNKYDGSKIKILKGLDSVRHRPGMFIDDTGKRGILHLIREISDNSFDEAIAGHAKNIQISIAADGETVTVEDDGRGIPVDIHPTEGKSALEVAMTVLHAGGKMTSEEDGYMASGGLHGVGASCVNALSDFMIVEVCRDGFLYSQKYERGVPKTPVEQIRKLGKSDKKTGTKSEWHPDNQIFKNGLIVDEAEIIKYLKKSAFLIRGLCINYENLHTGTKEIYKYDGGIHDYVLDLVKTKNGLYPDVPIYVNKMVSNIQVEIATIWDADDADNLMAFANNIYTPDGGTHLTGFKTSLTRSINTLARKSNLLKEKDENLDGRDLQEGLTAIVSVRLPQPQFTGQGKTRLTTAEAEATVSAVLADALDDYLGKNPKIFSKIVERAQLSQRARKAAKDASNALKKKSFLGQSGRIPEKLRDCRSSDNNITELFLVEGSSAAGSGTQGRDSETQAILALKGKIINAEKNSIADMLKNDEVSDLIMAIGTGFKDNFDITKLKYGKIIILADSDSDGKHICTLLLAFFYRYMKPLIEAGHVYVARAPLYMVESKVPVYCWDNDELQIELSKHSGKMDVKRFKGLGEMNADQLGETTLKKGNRKIIQIQIDDAVKADEMMEILMGKNVQIRKQHIISSVNGTSKALFA